MRIVCAVDFSDAARDALRAAIELARGSDDELRLVHVLERARLAEAIGAERDGTRLVDEIAARAEHELELWRRDATVKVPGTRAIALAGVAWEEIVREAEESQADLVVLGGGRRRGRIGPVAERVVRHAPCSALVMVGPAVTFSDVLCAVDFSSQARVAVGAAADLAARHHGRLTLLHAVSPASFVPGGWLAYEALARGARRDADNRLLAWSELAARAGLAVTTRVVDGTPAEAIAEAARAGPHDLIVVGTHGRSGVTRVLLGSVAEEVLRHADRPVLVVRGKRNA